MFSKKILEAIKSGNGSADLGDLVKRYGVSGVTLGLHVLESAHLVKIDRGPYVNQYCLTGNRVSLSK